MSLPSSVTQPSKSFWKRPEGKTGMGFAIAGIAALGLGIAKILPFLIGLMQNTITAIGLGVALLALVWVILDKRNWVLAGYFYKSLMRRITQTFVEIDPIGIMRNYVSDLKKKSEQMQAQISNLRGQIRILKGQVEANEAQRQQALQMAKVARDKEKQGVFALQARQAGRLERSNLTLTDLLQRMELLYRVLAKMKESSDLLISDIENEVDYRAKERKTIKAAHSAMIAARAIMQGEPDKLDLFNQALEFTASDYGQKLGEIEEFVDISRTIMETTDLQNGVFEQQAIDLLDQWERKTESLLLGPAKQSIIADTKNPSKVLDVEAELPSATRPQGKYTKLLGNE